MLLIGIISVLDNFVVCQVSLHYVW